MRSNSRFIEVTGRVNGKRFLLNKSVITSVVQEDETEMALILTKDVDKMKRIPVKESYADLTKELLWEWGSAR